MTTTMTTARKPFAARCAAVLGIAGTVLLSVAPTAPVFAADPPSWARHDDDHKNDRKDEQRDKKDIKNDVRQLRRDQADLRNDRRDDRKDNNRDDRRDDHNNDWRNNDRDRNNNDRYNNRDDHRSDGFRNRVDQVRQQAANQQKNKNDWRNLTLLGGAATVYGVLNHDPTVAFIGAAGTLYSASRYDQDRRSQSQSDRARAELFERGSFDRDGVHYTKHDKWDNGKHYYYFSR